MNGRRRRLGQHFLADRRIAARLVEYASVGPGDTVLEVGPGTGILTEELARRAGRVVAVEKDRALAGQLRWLPANVELVTGDALRVDWLAHGTISKFVANIPYSISSPLLGKFLDSAIPLAVLTLQEEFAERLVARPGTPDYSRLTVNAFMNAESHLLERVKRGAFRPPPRVDSAVVRLTKRPAPFPVRDPLLFARIVAAGFSHRRKRLSSVLREWWPATLIAGIRNAERRIGELSPGEIAAISDALAQP